MMQTLFLFLLANKFAALGALLVVLIFILFAVKRKKVKKNAFEVSKTLTGTEITDTFKKLVGDIDLNLENSHLDAKALEEVEETLLALKELYEKKYISEEVYLTRTDALIKSLDNKHGA